MNKTLLNTVALTFACALSANAATYIGTSTYTGYDASSPFSSTFGAITLQDPNGEAGESDTTGRHDFRGIGASVAAPNTTYFFLEDVQDGQLDLPGATFSGGVLARTTGGINGSNNSSSANTDNVAEDTIINSSFRTTANFSVPEVGQYQGYIRVDFNAAELGGVLPTFAGIVFAERTTDSSGTPLGAGRLFEAYDADDNLLEQAFVAAASATVVDGFVGVSTTSGISYVLIAGDNEYDHFQFGTVVPEPSTTLLGSLGFLALLRRRR